MAQSTLISSQSTPNGQASTPNFEDVGRFLQPFFPDANEDIHFRALAAKGDNLTAREIVVTRNQLATVHRVWQDLLSLNEMRGLYFCVNAGGGTDAEINRFNAFFCENDDLSIEEQHAALDAFPLKPSISVETLKSVHAYWLTDGCTEEDWRDVQAKLITFFNADPKIKNPSRLMRLPYFNHVSYHPESEIYSLKPVTLNHFDSSLNYAADAMREAFSKSPGAAHEVGVAASNDNAGVDLSTWDALNAEARRRIRRLPGAHMEKDGEWLHVKGVCHSGTGDKGLYLNLDSNAYGCFAECDTATILRSLGLPKQPQAQGSNAHGSRLVSSWREFSGEQFPVREKVIFELEPGEVGALCASTDVGKTTLGLNLSLMLAAGGAFPPLATFREGGQSVLYIDGETRKGRLQADVGYMLRDWDSSERELVERNFHVICDGAIGDEALDLANYSHRQKVRAEAFEVKPALIVIDTLSSLFAVQNENDNAEMSKRVMRPLAKLAADTGAAILLVHHIGKMSEDAQAGTKAYRGRGASVIGAAARLVLLMKQDSQDDRLVSLTCAKAKGRKFEDVLLRLGESRWFTNTGQTPAKLPSSYERVIEAVQTFAREVKRSEIDVALKGTVSESQVGKHLKAATNRGDLIQNKHGYYSKPGNAHVLNAIDNEYMSRSKEGVQPLQDLHAANAHSLSA